MDIYTVIFAALAVFILLRLRSVLRPLTGSERPPVTDVASEAKWYSAVYRIGFGTGQRADLSS